MQSTVYICAILYTLQMNEVIIKPHLCRVHSVRVTEHRTVLLRAKSLWGLHLFVPGYKCFLSQVRVYPQIPIENLLMILYSDCKIVVLLKSSWKKKKSE